MFTGNEDVEATALREQGWSISAIARHLNRDRETIRNHLNGTRVAGERKRSEPDPFEAFVPYLGARLGEDPHVWATALYDEVSALGFELSYQSFTRGLRSRELRPHCEACAGVKGRPTIEIEHPPGAEIQWDWDELPEAPWGDDAHLLLGSLPCSGKFRGVFAESEDQGSVEKSIHFATQRFWRTMTAQTMAQGQQQLDRFCERIADRRPRPLARLEDIVGRDAACALLAARRRRRPTVGDLAELERLRPLPAACYPATIEATNLVGPSALVAFEGNAYSVPPGLIGADVSVRHRLGTAGIEIVSKAGILLASHSRQAPGGGYVVRDAAHKAGLEHEVLTAFTSDPPCRRKANRPPGDGARAEAQKLLSSFEDDEVVVSLAAYQALVDDMARRSDEALP
jgi:hypothetical protein